MIELLLSMAVIAILLPFIVSWQKDRITRAENIVIANNIAVVRDALERYMDVHRKEFLTTVSRNITRVRITDLAEYGVPAALIEKHGNEFQLRILKSADVAGHAVLQGIVIMRESDLNPMRTRRLAMLGGEGAGFIEGNIAYGAFGTWGASVGELGARGQTDSVAANTRRMRSGDEYIWRMPSDDITDATMGGDLDMGGHEITQTRYVDTRLARFEESLDAREIGAGRLIHSNRAELSGSIEITGESTVNGILSSDSRSMQINGDIILDNSARFNNVNTKELWANNMTLAGMSVSGTDDRPATLRVRQALDMSGGRISALFVSVGFAGSLTPRLLVRNMIRDTVDGYHWNVKDGDAYMSDIIFPNLNQLMKSAASGEGTGTEAYQIMSTVAANSNATAADFMRALETIRSRVSAKYQNLNLE